MQKTTTKIPSPSFAGKTVIVVQAVLLALDHSSSKPSQNNYVSVAYLGLTPHYSGGTAPVLHRTFLLSPYGHLYLFNFNEFLPITPFFDFLCQRQNNTIFG